MRSFALSRFNQEVGAKVLEVIDEVFRWCLWLEEELSIGEI